MTILELKKLTGESSEPQQAEVQAQARGVITKTTKDGKPFWHLDLADATSDFTLRVWNNHPAFYFCGTIKQGDGISLTGAWKKSDFGIESDRWTGRLLDEFERLALLQGSAELQAKQQRDWNDMMALVNGMQPGPWKSLSLLLLNDYEKLFRRAAAARGNHHARRGGLVEHTAQMMRAAAALCNVYNRVMNREERKGREDQIKDDSETLRALGDLSGFIQRDLVLAGVLFHDCGKMWENQYEEQGFEMPFTLGSECTGHIIIGIGVAQSLWRKIEPQRRGDAEKAAGSENSTELRASAPPRLALDLLIHLIASHHGTLEWGSPVEPKCPEAIILHHVDNIDAKIEMMRGTYATAKRIGEGVFERAWPMKVNLISTTIVRADVSGESPETTGGPPVLPKAGIDLNKIDSKSVSACQQAS
jgi:3'-5' exoribonuclease